MGMGRQRMKDCLGQQILQQNEMKATVTLQKSRVCQNESSLLQSFRTVFNQMICPSSLLILGFSSQFKYFRVSPSSMKTPKQLALPLSLLQNQTALKLKYFMSFLSPQSAFFSCILYQKQGKMFFLRKDDTFPYIPVDWTLYTFMRSYSRTIVTSGKSLRSEKEIYGESRGTYGKEELAYLYQQNAPDPFNLIVYSKIMSDDEIRKIICQKYFKLLPLSQIWGQNASTPNFKDFAYRINSLKIGPTIYENGDETLREGFDLVSEREQNFTQMIVLSIYQGQIPSRYISKQYDIKMLQKDFTKVWESPLIESGATKIEGDKNVGALKFQVYIRTDKAHQYLA